MENQHDELAEAFIQMHKGQLVTNNVPEKYWNTLFIKLKDEIFDAGNYFQIMQMVNEDDELSGTKSICHDQNGLKTTDPLGVFLIDHAWTYRVNEARKYLQEIDGLSDRMKMLMNIHIERQDGISDEAYEKQIIEAILEEMWKFNQTYTMTFENMTDEEREPRWYIMDEFGSSITHSDTPNVKTAPFYYLPTRIMFTIMWPLIDIQHQDEVTRDFANGVKDEQLRRAKLVPWLETDCTDIDTKQEEPNEAYFMSARESETLPTNTTSSENLIASLLQKGDRKVNVYTDLEIIKEFLTDPEYTIVENQNDADIIFSHQHFKDYKGLQEKKPHCLINQFPFENVVTVKDMLAVVCRRVEDSKKWLPVTYNLKEELPKLVSYFQQRENEDLDNYWIIKPWNLARSIDTYVTKNLNQIIRLQESGPKIACKYITNPVLFYRDELDGRVKFDVRYIVLLRSVKPLVLYTYKVFWLRFANKPYSLDDLDDYEKHFTVMNYKPINLKQINCDQFIPMFEEQNPLFTWQETEQKVFKMIRQVFEGASMKEPPMGFSNNPQSKAMYAVDLMLDWRTSENGDKTIEPMICEVNFMPDCTRACKYHPKFFNDVFNTLFLDKSENCNVTKL